MEAELQRLQKRLQRRAEGDSPIKKKKRAGGARLSWKKPKRKVQPLPPHPKAAWGDSGGAGGAETENKYERMWGAGIVTPWLYFMGPNSCFSMHFEDYAFGSANVIVAEPNTQAWVVWYSVPRGSLRNLHRFLKDHLGEAYTLDVLEMRRLWVDPAKIARWNQSQPEERRVPVYRHVQGPGEYVVTDYGSVHWGVNLGVGWKAAVNLFWRK